MYVAQTRHKFDDPRTKPKQSLTELDGRAMWMDGRCGWTGDVDCEHFGMGPLGGNTASHFGSFLIVIIYWRLGNL